jgi:hypothetical protein
MILPSKRLNVLLVSVSIVLPVGLSQVPAVADPQSSTTSNLYAQAAREENICPYPDPVNADQIEDCTNRYSAHWDETLMKVKSQQKKLIAGKSLPPILQIIGTTGVATAATLGLADSGNDHTVAIVVGSAGLLAAILGTIWKAEPIDQRIAACKYVIELDPKFDAVFQDWRGKRTDPTFQNKFSSIRQEEYWKFLASDLGKCAPGLPVPGTPSFLRPQS